MADAQAAAAIRSPSPTRRRAAGDSDVGSGTILGRRSPCDCGGCCAAHGRLLVSLLPLVSCGEQRPVARLVGSPLSETARPAATGAADAGPFHREPATARQGEAELHTECTDSRAIEAYSTPQTHHRSFRSAETVPHGNGTARRLSHSPRIAPANMLDMITLLIVGAGQPQHNTAHSLHRAHCRPCCSDTAARFQCAASSPAPVSSRSIRCVRTNASALFVHVQAFCSCL